MEEDEFAHLPSMMTDDTPEARAWRREQSEVDSDIAGLAPSDPESIAFREALDKLDLSTEERIARLIEYYKKQDAQARQGK